MKNYSLLIFISLIVVISSCNSSQSLQEYIVDKQQDNEFISIDIPANIISLKEDKVGNEATETLKSIKKINFLGLKLTESNKAIYSTEKQNIKDILSDKKFKEIFRLKSGKSEVSVKYLGEEENIDEAIFYGADNEKGLVLVRVLGDHMNPSKILQLINKINVDKNSTEFKSLSSIFDSVK